MKNLVEKWKVALIADFFGPIHFRGGEMRDVGAYANFRQPTVNNRQQLRLDERSQAYKEKSFPVDVLPHFDRKKSRFEEF